MVKVSVIMPVYNGEEFLEVSVESVARQTLKDIELICVDDGSEDNSLELLMKLREKYPFIKILTQENQGSGKARNYGIDEASGDYIAFIDADDIFVDPDSMELLYKEAIINGSDIVSGNLKKLTRDRVLEDNPNCPENNYYCFTENCIISPEEYGVPWAFYKNLFKTAFLNENNIRFRDLIRGQDPVFMAETLACANEVYGVNTDFYAYMFPIPGRPYYKVNNSKKKLHYITHYKDTFDIFEGAGMYDASEKYKEKVMRYFNYSVRVNDGEIYDLTMDVFGEDNDYFRGYQAEYDAFRAHHIVAKINVFDTQEYYDRAKSKLKTLNLASNAYLSDDLNSKLVTIFSCDTLNEYSESMEIKNIETYELENERLEKSLDYHKNLNDELSTSSSWKMTAPLRKIINTFRK